jgi:hypothetical protein
VVVGGIDCRRWGGCGGGTGVEGQLMRAAVFDAMASVSSSPANSAILVAARAVLVDGLAVEAAAEAAYGEPRNIHQVRKKVEKLRDLAVRIEAAFSEKNIK